MTPLPRLLLSAAALALTLSGCGRPAADAPAAQAEAQAAPAPRIVSLGGAVTEILYAVGAGDLIVGSDTTSMYPAEAMQTPKVGYLRQLSAEGVLSLNPTLIIGTPDMGPPQIVDQLRSAGVEIVTVSGDKTREGLDARIAAAAQAGGHAEAAQALQQKVAADWQALDTLAASHEAKPSILFIYARSGAGINVSGTNTAADAVIGLIGGRNAVTGYEGYRPLTAEAAVAAAPDIILMTSQGLESIGGPETLWQTESLALTPAGKAGRVLTADELPLLGFGPRTPAALVELARAVAAEPVATASR